MDVVSNLNNIYGDIHNIIIENEKTTLYEIYYDVELRDGMKGISKHEWDQLFARLSIEQRKCFLKFGTFEEIAGNDGMVSFQEFQDLVKKMLQSYDKVIVRARSRSMLN